MVYVNCNYFVKGIQLYKLIDALGKVEEFHKAITDKDGRFRLDDIEENDLMRAFGNFSEAVREMKHLTEDIDAQEILQCG